MRQSFTIETVEERTMMSAAILSQHPMLVMSPWSGPAAAQNQGPSSGPSSGPQSGPQSGPVQNSIPAAPTGLTAQVAGADSIALTWDAVDPAADTIVVDYSTDGVTFVTLAMLEHTDTNFTASELTAGQTYSFKLWAMNANGTSPASSTVMASL